MESFLDAYSRVLERVILSQEIITCSNSTIETLEKVAKFVQSWQ